MKTQLKQWGNSLAVRIPKTVADAASLKKGDALELLSTGRGKMEIRVAKSKPTLSQLVKGITAENRHEESNWGRSAGNELW